jgi:hypothetical protein
MNLSLVGNLAMQQFRATLIDDNSQAIADVEGSIESPEGTEGSRRGRFEVQDDPSFMQGVLDKRTFHLQLDDGGEIAIKVDSASPTSKPGVSVVEFSCTAV